MSFVREVASEISMTMVDFNYRVPNAPPMLLVSPLFDRTCVNISA